MHREEELDHIIMNAINDDTYAFNKMCKECKKSPRTLSSHLKKLQGHKMIEWSPPVLYGERGKWELTPVGKSYLEYGLELDIESKRKKKETKEEIRKREEDEQNLLSFRLLLSTAAVGAVYGKLTSKPSGGNLAVKNRSTGEWEAYRFTMKEGVSVADIVNHKLTNSGLSFIEFSKEKLENLIKKLSKGDSPILKPIKCDEDGEIRFGIADPMLRNFIRDCYMILDSARRRMEFIWTFVRCPKKVRSKGRRSPEVEWYSWICGSRYAGKFMANLDERRRCQYDTDSEEYAELLRNNRLEFKGRSPTQEELIKMHEKASFDYDIRFSMKRKEAHIKFADELVKMCVANLDNHCKATYDDAQLDQKYPVAKIIRKNVFPDFLSSYQKDGKV